MKIVCISDTHCQHRQIVIPNGDLLIHAGDFLSTGWEADALIDFDDWLGELPHPHKVVIAGNHDRGLNSSSEMPCIS